MTPDGMIIAPSQFAPDVTAERVIAAVTARGMAVMARIDHAAAAAGVGLVLPPTQVLMFGNPKAGTVLMQAEQTSGIDLPLKILVWQDAEGATWIGYNDPHWIAKRHGAAIGGDPVINAMVHALVSVAKDAGEKTT
jgi:uncharacterized protein (DUF302 family)